MSDFSDFMYDLPRRHLIPLESRGWTINNLEPVWDDIQTRFDDLESDLRQAQKNEAYYKELYEQQEDKYVESWNTVNTLASSNENLHQQIADLRGDVETWKTRYFASQHEVYDYEEGVHE